MFVLRRGAPFSERNESEAQMITNNKKEQQAKLIQEYAIEKGIGLRAAQKHCKQMKADWLNFLTRTAPNAYAVENAIRETTEYTPREGVRRARMIYESAWAEFERAKKRLEEIQAPHSRARYNLSKELPLAQKGYDLAINILGKAQIQFEAAATTEGRLVHITAIEELFRHFTIIFEEINRLPETLAAETSLAAVEAERLVREILISRINPLVDQAENAFQKIRG